MAKKVTTKPVKKTRTLKETKASYEVVAMQVVTRVSPVVIATQIAELPVEAQELAAEFVLMLRRRYVTEAPKQVTKRLNLEDEPFVGMWADRPEMADSVAYIRELRRRQFSPDRHK
ncbi:MAG: hypothetical protein HC853_17895 [Anaerolineae bacterium]|nr:hypothetical protein [Anaerolineae bacterium]